MQAIGTFDRIKQLSKWLIILFAVTLVLFFTIGDNTVVQGLRGSEVEGSEIGEVDGEPISRLEYDKQIDQYLEYQKMQGIVDENIEQLSNQIWNNLVNNVLFEKEFQKTGLFITDERIKDILIETPPNSIARNFRDSLGNFDKNSYFKFITNPEGLITSNPNMANMPQEEKQKVLDQWRGFIMQVEDSIRKSTPNNNYRGLLSEAATMMSPSFAKQLFKMEATSTDCEYAAFPINKYPAQNFKVSQQEIAKYYEAHKEDFKAEDDAVKLKYIVIPITPLKSDSLKVTTRIKKVLSSLAEGKDDIQRDSIFEMRLTEYAGSTFDYTAPTNIKPEVLNILNTMLPKQVIGPILLNDTTFFYRLDGKSVGKDTTVKARHILVKWNDETKKDSAKAFAISLIKKIQGGEDFAMLAAQHSIDKGSGQQGGELGWFGKGQMVPAFDKACFNNSGLITEPVETEFGYHIIDVTDKNSEKIKYSKLAFIPKVNQISKNHYRNLAIGVATQLKDGKSIEVIAKNGKYIPGETTYLSTGMPLVITNPEFIASRFFVDTALVAEKGNVLFPRVFEKCVVIAKVEDKRSKDGYQSLEEVGKTIEAEIIKEKQFARAKKDAKAFMSKISSMGGFAQAKAMDSTLPISILPGLRPSTNLPEVGPDPLFIAKISSSPLNKIIGPFKGQNAVYVFKAVSKTEPTKQQVEANFAQYADQYRMQEASSIYQAWFMKYRKNSEVIDNRYLFYEKY